MDLYANVLLGRKGTGWRAVSCDPWGLDLMRNDLPARLDFDAMVRDAGAMRTMLVDLVKRARAGG